MSTITVWMIVVIMNSGHRVELPNHYGSEVECLAVAQSTERAHPGARAACVASAFSLSDERTKQMAGEAWWRSRPVETDAARKP